MNTIIHTDVLKFLFGFLGMVFVGLSVLVAVGFYQTEISGNSNISETVPTAMKTASLSN